MGEMTYAFGVIVTFAPFSACSVFKLLAREWRCERSGFAMMRGGFKTAGDFDERRLGERFAEELDREGHAVGGKKSAGNNDRGETGVRTEIVAVVAGEITFHRNVRNRRGLKRKDERIELVAIHERNQGIADDLLVF